MIKNDVHIPVFSITSKTVPYQKERKTCFQNIRALNGLTLQQLETRATSTLTNIDDGYPSYEMLHNVRPQNRLDDPHTDLKMLFSCQAPSQGKAQ